MEPGMLRSFSELHHTFPALFIDLGETSALGNLRFLTLIPLAPQGVEFIESFHTHVLDVARLQATSLILILKL